MFGYFKLDKACPNLLGKKYKRYYCLLCHALQRHYGMRARFLLSFDVTFFLILSDSNLMFDGEQKIPCVKTSNEVRKLYGEELLRKAAALNILLAAGKLEDDKLDEGSIKSKVAEWIFRKQIRRAKKDYPLMFQSINNGYAVIRQLEKNNGDLEEIENAFSDMMAEIGAKYFGILGENEQYLLKMATRWLYFIDAVDDLDDNIEDGTFNPLKSYGSFNNLKNQNYIFLGNHFQSFYAKRLPSSKSTNMDIIFRVFFYGMPEETIRVLSKRR